MEGGGGVLNLCMTVRRHSHPYCAATEHVVLSPTKRKLLAPNAKCRKVFGDSHEG